MVRAVPDGPLVAARRGRPPPLAHRRGNPPGRRGVELIAARPDRVAPADAGGRGCDAGAGGRRAARRRAGRAAATASEIVARPRRGRAARVRPGRGARARRLPLGRDDRHGDGAAGFAATRPHGSRSCSASRRSWPRPARKGWRWSRPGFAPGEWQLFVVGVGTSAVVGYATVAGFLRYLARHSLDVFAWYRLAVAAAFAVWLLVR